MITSGMSLYTTFEAGQLRPHCGRNYTLYRNILIAQTLLAQLNNRKETEHER